MVNTIIYIYSNHFINVNTGIKIKLITAENWNCQKEIMSEKWSNSYYNISPAGQGSEAKIILVVDNNLILMC